MKKEEVKTWVRLGLSEKGEEKGVGLSVQYKKEILGIKKKKKTKAEVLFSCLVEDRNHPLLPSLDYCLFYPTSLSTLGHFNFI